MRTIRTSSSTWVIINNSILLACISIWPFLDSHCLPLMQALKCHLNCFIVVWTLLHSNAKYLCYIYIWTLLYYSSGTIWVNALLHNVFGCIAIYCNISICEWILVKRHFIWIMGMWVLVVKKRTIVKKLYVKHFTRGSVNSVVYT